jgi:ABC-type phosphate transport system permease subunit
MIRNTQEREKAQQDNFWFGVLVLIVLMLVIIIYAIWLLLHK